MSAHREPVILSGSAVLGVPSASIGAPWFHRASVGTHSAFVGDEVVGGDAAIEDFGFAVDAEDPLLGQFLEDVAQAQHDDLVATTRTRLSA